MLFDVRGERISWAPGLPIPKLPYRDMFKGDDQALVIPVNTVGVMGSGIAKRAKLSIPRLFEAYRNACRTHAFTRQGIVVCAKNEYSKFVLLPTKHDWKNVADLALIEHGLKTLAETYEEHGLESISLPPLGCGCGQIALDDSKASFGWPEVWELYFKYLALIDLKVTVIGFR